MFMKQELQQALLDLPVLIKEAKWNSLFVDYHKPYVERLWLTLGDLRYNLHKIHPCKKDDALYHPHPWPSIMLVLDGEYEMGIGSKDTILTTTLMGKGSLYSSNEITSYHYVAPVVDTYTVMITDKPYSDAPKSKVKKAMRPLSDEEQSALKDAFAGLIKNIQR